MSDKEPTVKYSAELSKSAFVPTAVNVTKLSPSQRDIAELCARIAVDQDFAFWVASILDGAGAFPNG